MDAKKLKPLLIFVVVAVILLIVIGSRFGERIHDFMNGFVTGLAFTLLAGAGLVLWEKLKKK